MRRIGLWALAWGVGALLFATGAFGGRAGDLSLSGSGLVVAKRWVDLRWDWTPGQALSANTLTQLEIERAGRWVPLDEPVRIAARRHRWSASDLFLDGIYRVRIVANGIRSSARRVLVDRREPFVSIVEPDAFSVSKGETSVVGDVQVGVAGARLHAQALDELDATAYGVQVVEWHVVGIDRDFREIIRVPPPFVAITYNFPAPGRYRVVARAYDWAGHSSEQSVIVHAIDGGGA